MRTAYLVMSALSAAVALWQGYALFVDGYRHLLSATLATTGAVAWYLIYWTQAPPEIASVKIGPVRYLRAGAVSRLDIGAWTRLRSGDAVKWGRNVPAE